MRILAIIGLLVLWILMTVSWAVPIREEDFEVWASPGVRLTAITDHSPIPEPPPGGA